MPKKDITPPNSLEVLNTPENQERIAKFKAQAEISDRKKEETAKIFDPVALLKRASAIHEFTHPTLGIVRFGELTLNDSAMLEKCPSPASKTAMIYFGF
jgi:hypothetical protein